MYSAIFNLFWWKFIFPTIFVVTHTFTKWIDEWMHFRLLNISQYFSFRLLFLWLGFVCVQIYLLDKKVKSLILQYNKINTQKWIILGCGIEYIFKSLEFRMAQVVFWIENKTNITQYRVQMNFIGNECKLMKYTRLKIITIAHNPKIYICFAFAPSICHHPLKL